MNKIMYESKSTCFAVLDVWKCNDDFMRNMLRTAKFLFIFLGYIRFIFFRRNASLNVRPPMRQNDVTIKKRQQRISVDSVFQFGAVVQKKQRLQLLRL